MFAYCGLVEHPHSTAEICFFCPPSNVNQVRWVNMALDGCSLFVEGIPFRVGFLFAGQKKAALGTHTPTGPIWVASSANETRESSPRLGHFSKPLLVLARPLAVSNLQLDVQICRCALGSLGLPEPEKNPT